MTLFIFLITLALNGLLAVVGEDVLAEFLGANPALSVFGSALVGLVPNCAASIVIAQLYVEGVLGSGAMLAGLLVSAGVGLLVLVRTNRHLKENIAIIVALYAMGVIWGLLANALGIVFWRAFERIAMLTSLALWGSIAKSIQSKTRRRASWRHSRPA